MRSGKGGFWPDRKRYYTTDFDVTFQRKSNIQRTRRILTSTEALLHETLRGQGKVFDKPTAFYETNLTRRTLFFLPRVPTPLIPRTSSAHPLPPSAPDPPQPRPTRLLHCRHPPINVILSWSRHVTGGNKRRAPLGL